MNKLDFPPKIKQEMMERDRGCIYCGATSTLTYAHIFVPRSKGGLGVLKNGGIICMRHHHILDNGSDSKTAKKIDKYCKDYLTNIYGEVDLESLKYNKWKNFKYNK